MQDPSCEIVDGFRGAEGLMTGFVGDDPESGTEESHPDGDGGVDGSSDEVVSGFREVKTRDKPIRLETSPDQTPNRNKILDDILSTLHRAPLVTMSRNSIQQLFDRKRGGDENFASGHGGGFLGLLFEGGLGDEGVFLRLTGSLTDGRGDGHGLGEKSSFEW